MELMMIATIGIGALLLLLAIAGVVQNGRNERREKEAKISEAAEQ